MAWQLTFPLLLTLSVGLLGCRVPATTEAPAPDATQTGPYPILGVEYALPPSLDPSISAERVTQVHALVVRPADLSALERLPIVVLLHGNHATCGRRTNGVLTDSSCEFTTTGECGAQEVPIPSYRGYDYFAHRLASWGIVVVSVNANRGINCAESADPSDGGLIWARARLVLRHLQLLQENRFQNALPSRAVDWTSIGLFGHSRGGEAMRALYQLIQNQTSSAFSIKGIFEIGATDRTLPARLDAPGVPWVGLLPLCDGDIDRLELQKPFDRSVRQRLGDFHALFAVQGANHNFFNSVWTTSDSSACVHQEPLNASVQQETGAATVLAFFRGIFGLPLPAQAPDSEQDQNPQATETTTPLPAREQSQTSSLLRVFDPRVRLPETWPVQSGRPIRVERAFLPKSVGEDPRLLEDFSQPLPQSRSGQPILTFGAIQTLTLHPPEHDPSLTVLGVQWTQSATPPSLEIPLNTSHGLASETSLHPGYLIFRSAVFPGSPSNGTTSPQDLDFTLQIRDSLGRWSAPYSIREWLPMDGPFGTPGHLHSILPTAIIDLSTLDVDRPAAIRFLFNRTPSGRILLGEFLETKTKPDP